MVAEEINRNIHEIRNVVTDTTHGVKQTAMRCEELDSVAKGLQSKIARFKY